jgi:hypothetical protein
MGVEYGFTSPEPSKKKNRRFREFFLLRQAPSQHVPRKDGFGNSELFYKAQMG